MMVKITRENLGIFYDVRKVIDRYIDFVAEGAKNSFKDRKNCDYVKTDYYIDFDNFGLDIYLEFYDGYYSSDGGEVIDDEHFYILFDELNEWMETNG